MKSAQPQYPESEIWKPIPGWEAYEISSWGRLRRFRYGKMRYLKPFKKQEGLFGDMPSYE